MKKADMINKLFESCYEVGEQWELYREVLGNSSDLANRQLAAWTALYIVVEKLGLRDEYAEYSLKRECNN